MSKEVAKVVVEAGIVDRDAFAQLQRWGYLTDVDIGGEGVLSGAALAERILEAVTSEEEVEIRATDLDLIKDYLSTRRRARLHVPSPEKEGQTIGIPVEYSTTKLGEVVIPWTSESISDQLLNDSTYLKPAGGPRIYFADVRELFYGEHKAFMVCVPVKEK